MYIFIEGTVVANLKWPGRRLAVISVIEIFNRIFCLMEKVGMCVGVCLLTWGMNMVLKCKIMFILVK